MADAECQGDGSVTFWGDSSDGRESRHVPPLRGDLQGGGCASTNRGLERHWLFAGPTHPLPPPCKGGGGKRPFPPKRYTAACRIALALALRRLYNN